MLGRLLKPLYLLLILTLPLSVPFTFGNHQINLPSEPVLLMLSILLLFIADFKELIHSPFIKHPLSLISIGYLGWMILVIPFSSDVATSIKYVAVNVAHWWVFFVGFWMLKSLRNQSLRMWLERYAIGLGLVIVYAQFNNFKFNFRPDASVLLAKPFFQDHALLSAVISLLIFYFLIQLYKRTRESLSLRWSLVGPFIFSALALSAIYFIPSRAAWLGLLISCAVGLLCLAQQLRWPLLMVGLFAFGTATAIFIPGVFKDPIKSEARKGSMLDHLKSTLNYTTDVSNLERINRYQCAWRMFRDRPIVGFGPGTFATAYLPFQKKSQMTRISVTAPQREDGRPHQEGRGGGAHSEYLQALAEGGIIGLISWVLLVVVATFTGVKNFFRKSTDKINFSDLAVLLGLVTYFIHGLFNNFLHNDELAALFWPMLGYLVMADLQEEDSDSVNKS